MVEGDYAENSDELPCEETDVSGDDYDGVELLQGDEGEHVACIIKKTPPFP